MRRYVLNAKMIAREQCWEQPLELLYSGRSFDRPIWLASDATDRGDTAESSLGASYAALFEWLCSECIKENKLRKARRLMREAIERTPEPPPKPAQPPKPLPAGTLLHPLPPPKPKPLLPTNKHEEIFLTAEDVLLARLQHLQLRGCSMLLDDLSFAHGIEPSKVEELERQSNAVWLINKGTQRKVVVHPTAKIISKIKLAHA